MFKVNSFVRKGGAGKSTLAFSVACYAAEKGYRVLLVSADPQGDSAKWAKGLDSRVRPDDHFESRHGFSVLFSSRVPPDAELGEYDLVVVDLPPVAEAVAWVRPQMWLIPLDGRNALEDTLPVIRAMVSQGGKIVFAPNKSDAAGLNLEADLLEGLHGLMRSIPGSVCLDPIPDSSAVARAAEYGEPPWRVPYGVRTQGAAAVVSVCDFVCTAVGKPKPKPKARRKAPEASDWRR